MLFNLQNAAGLTRGVGRDFEDDVLGQAHAHDGGAHVVGVALVVVVGVSRRQVQSYVVPVVDLERREHDCLKEVLVL